MGYKEVEKKDFNGKTVKVLAETYDEGMPECVGCGEDLGWRAHMQTKEQISVPLDNIIDSLKRTF